MEIAERRKRIATLYRQNHSQAEIAAIVGVSAATVCRDIQEIHEEWKESRIADIDTQKLKRSSELHFAMQQAEIAWEKSKRNNAPDVSCLDKIIKCNIELRKIWGTDAPTKTEHSGRIDGEFQTRGQLLAEIQERLSQLPTPPENE